MIKNNHDGTITLNANTWTSCNACGQQVTVDSIHTCSPQTLTKDTECQYCKQRCFRCDARKTLTDHEIRQVIDDQWEKTNNVNLFDFARSILKRAQEK
jgi:hypothetical protein